MIVDHECIECFVLFLNPTNAKLCFSDLKNEPNNSHQVWTGRY